jgi:hypothetical protein
MIQALLTYLIVALAAAWVLWSIVLPVRLRSALRRGLGLRAPVCGLSGEGAGCGEDGCRGCPLATLRAHAARAAAPVLRLHH